MRSSAHVALFAVLLFAPRAEAAPPAPFLSPWIVVGAGDVRVDALKSHAPSVLSPNAPGLLLAIDSFGDENGAASARTLVTNARSAGWRTGVSLTLTRTPIPEDARAAEAASADSLYPGLGRVLEAARGADLYVLRFPGLDENLRAQSFVLKKVASEIRAANPAARIAVVPGRFLDSEADGARARDLLSEENAAYVDLIGVRSAGRNIQPALTPEALRSAADSVAFGKPLFFESETALSPGELIALAARLAPAGAPFVAAPPNFDPSKDVLFERLGALLSGDFGSDARPAAAVSSSGAPLAVARLVSGLDLGGVVLVPGVSADGRLLEEALTLTLDGDSYSSAEIFELSTGRSRRLGLPSSASPPRLSLSTKNGPLLLRLLARAKGSGEAPTATVAVAEKRGLTAEEILARHQAWRAGRDARWSRLAGRNTMSIRFRFANLNNTLDLALAGAFFYEKGGGYDWRWSEAYFNGVRWKGKHAPQLPLVQPEKVSDMPLALTFDDAYRYVLTGEDTIDGIPCYALEFEPRAKISDTPLYAGTVWIAKSDFSARRTKMHQLNLADEIQSVDESLDFGEVPAADGGPPMLFPTHAKSQWILRTFSSTTVLERESFLTEVRLDPPGFEAERKEAYDSADTMVRDTERGVRYLEKTKDGERAVTEDTKRGRLFGIAGVFYDRSFDFPLPLAGLYYLDLDFRKKHEQVQVFFAGVILAASYNQPRLFGTTIDVGADVFGIAIRGSDSLYVGGTEDKTQRVKQRSFAVNLKAGYPLGRHVKISATLGETHRDFGADESETSPDFVIPSNHWLTRLESQAVWDYEGWALSGRFSWNKRSQWDPWGLPGNPDYDPSKAEFRTYGFQLAKDFHLANFQRITTSVSYLGSDNTDRFSKYTFGFYGPTSLRGFASGSLRAEEAVISRVAYGFVFGSAFRIEALYEDARVKDSSAGYDWAYFSGAGISGEMPGPWSTIMRLDFGTPVSGRNRGQGGVVVGLTFLKIFP